MPLPQARMARTPLIPPAVRVNGAALDLCQGSIDIPELGPRGRTACANAPNCNHLGRNLDYRVRQQFLQLSSILGRCHLGFQDYRPFFWRR